MTHFAISLACSLSLLADACKASTIRTGFSEDNFVSFLPRDALVHSAVLRLHVVRLSVRPSVTLVDQDRIGWKFWKLIARSIRPTPSLFVTQRPTT